MNFAAAVLLCTVAGSWTGTTPSGWRIDAQISATGRDVVGVFDLPDIGGFGRTLAGTIDDDCKIHLERAQPAGRPALVLDGLAVNDAITGEFQLLGAKSAVRLAHGPPLPTHREEEVTFENGPIRLAGTLILPDAKGTYPAVVFTHGSGTETRNTAQSLALVLARHGVASLVYDKRGSGASMGHWEVASMEDLAGDAIAAVAALRARSDIDSARIGIYGYSQGGWVAPLAAMHDPSIAFVVAGGLSGVNPMEQTIHHRMELMRQDHFDTAAIRQAMDLWREIYRSDTKDERAKVQAKIDKVRSAPWFEASGLPAQLGGTPSKGLREFLRFEPVTAWANIHQPVFLFWGADDLNVPVRDTLRSLASVIASDDFTARVYPHIGHDLRIESADLPRISKEAMYGDWVEWVERTVHVAPASFDAHAASYVKLVLALGEHDADWVDAYYGPPEWRESAKAEKKSVAVIHDEAAALRDAVEHTAVPRDAMLRLRRKYLIEQLGALITKAEMLGGTKLSFAEEARRLYGATPQRHDDAFFANAVRALESEIPGEGPLPARLEAYRSRFNLPADKLDPVIRAALKECRARTLQHVQLPAHESFTLEYVKNQPWSGYNWYKGNATSLIQVNTDLPVAISRAIDLACHEGYPGHHTYNALLEKNLVRDRGWIEYTVYPLNSPQSLIAEGSGNYGITMAFPGNERMQFDRDVLFPLAGFDPAEAPRYHRVLELTKALGYASSEVAQRYLDGAMTRDEAKAWLVRYGLSTSERAEQQMKFAERYRSYVINYTLGQDLVREYVERSPDRWKAFLEMLSTPMLPDDL